MRQGKTLLSKMGILLLAVCMLPGAPGMAAAQGASGGEITAFAELAGGVAAQTVPPVTPLAVLTLPASLKAAAAGAEATLPILEWNARPACAPDTAGAHRFTPLFLRAKSHLACPLHSARKLAHAPLEA